MNDTLVIGLTGQTGAGKSTVSSILREKGIAIIDADQISRAVVDERKQCLADLALEFSIDILNVDGTLNRARLADIVFRDKQRLKRLNAIVFPYIIDSIREELVAYNHSGVEMAVLDAPTLFESGSEKFCSVVLSVIAPENERINRIVIRDRLTDSQARARVGAQHGDEFYTSRSHYVIENTGSLEELRLKTLEILAAIQAEDEKQAAAQ